MSDDLGHIERIFSDKMGTHIQVCFFFVAGDHPLNVTLLQCYHRTPWSSEGEDPETIDTDVHLTCVCSEQI
jgi:hypothetical protein